MQLIISRVGSHFNFPFICKLVGVQELSLENSNNVV